MSQPPRCQPGCHLSRDVSLLAFLWAMLVDVVCPEGVAEGDLISIQHPETTESYDVAIPPGVGPGVSFQVELPEQQQQVAIAMPPEPPERRLPSAGPAVAVVAPLGMRESTGEKLTPANAEALHNIMEALFVYDELDAYIHENAAAFGSYSPEGEQRLEWTTMHGHYVALVESRVSVKLRELEVDETALYQLLGEVQGADSRADAFLARLLTMGDYGYFCSQMALGGGALKVSGEDLRALRLSSRAALLAAAKARQARYRRGRPVRRLISRLAH